MFSGYWINVVNKTWRHRLEALITTDRPDIYRTYVFQLKHSHFSKQLSSLCLYSKSQIFQKWKWIRPFHFGFNWLSTQASEASEKWSICDQRRRLVGGQTGRRRIGSATAHAYLSAIFSIFRQSAISTRRFQSKLIESLTKIDVFLLICYCILDLCIHNYFLCKC